jgi:hypothetical protein
MRWSDDSIDVDDEDGGDELRKRARKTKRMDSEEVKALKVACPACMYVFQDVI